MAGLSFGCTQHFFQLRPGLFYRIQIRRIGRQIEQLRPSCLNAFPHTLYLVAAEIVHHHHIARHKHRTVHMVEIGQEGTFIRK